MQVFFYGLELSSDGSEIIIHFNTPTNKRDNDKLTTRTENGPGTGSSGLRKISSRYFAFTAKNKNLAGRSRIGVLVMGFSRIGAVTKHAPLIFTGYIGSKSAKYTMGKSGKPDRAEF